MNFNNIKLFIPYQNLILTQNTLDGKNNCFYFYGENVNFIETYNFLNFRRQYIKHVFVPSTAKPRSFLTPDYTKVLRDRNLLPIKGRIGEYSKLKGLNFFFDATRYLNTLDKVYKIQRYNIGYGASLYNEYVMSSQGIDKSSFDTTLLYAINTDKPVPLKFEYKKNYIIFKMLFDYSKGNIEKLPFEKVVLFIFNKDGGQFVKIYDQTAPNNNITRVRKMLMGIQQISDNVTIDDNNNEHIATAVSIESKLVEPEKENIVKTAIKNYLKSNNEINKNITDQNSDSLVTKAVVYNMVGNIEQSHEIAKQLEKVTPEKRKQIINKLSVEILPRPDCQNASTNMIIKSIDVPKILDYQSPEHIFQKRKSDFHDKLKTDIEDAFKILEKKNMPLKFKSIKVDVIESGSSEIYKTIKDRYEVVLEDTEGNENVVNVDVPHLTENGSFLVNGQQKVLVNQLVRFPIFFPSINVARFESSYSVMKIHSKELTTGSYLILFMGSYKLPLIMYLAYKYGFSEVLKEYGIEYSIS